MRTRCAYLRRRIVYKVYDSNGLANCIQINTLSYIVLNMSTVER